VPVRREDLNRAILNFRSTLTDPTESVKNIVESARELYNWLIKPIENDLTQAQANTIIYAPDGQLRYIPLAALHDGKQWLVQRFNINNITAASLIDFNPQSLDEFHVFAGAFTTGRYSFQVGMHKFDFAGLPFAGKEVSEIATLIPNTTKLLDSAFNREATVPNLNDYNIVHLATHGVFVRGQPEESFILFGDGDRATLRDIETWNLTADLVILSACQTGIGGQLGNGEEILGLGYQMQQAGAKATIASLWTVSDEGTQRLMSAFYQTLQSRKTSTAEALRQAQLTLINDNYNQGRPYYWAPFILIGNGF
jgi:CHAT domain-containing protein